MADNLINCGPLSSSNPYLFRFRQFLETLCIGSGDIIQSDKSASELAEFLDALSDSVATTSDSEHDDLCNNALEMLMYALAYIRSPSVKEAVTDALSFILPKAVCKFSGASPKFSSAAQAIIEQLVLTCNPRDMLPVLYEALDSPSETINLSLYLSPLLGGISKVLLSLKRHQFEEIKVAIPLILCGVRQASLDLDQDDDEYLVELFGKAIGIANSIHNIHQKLEGPVTEKLRDLLCLYILQIMTHLSISIGQKVPNCIILVTQIMQLFHYCQLSYMSLITGLATDTLTGSLCGEEDDVNLRYCFPNVELGASLSVIWGYVSNDVAQSAKEDITKLMNELQHDQSRRWQALGMLKHIYSSVDLPWNLKKYAVDFLLRILEGDISRASNCEHSELWSFLPGLYAALRGIEMVIMYAPDALLRKAAYNALKRVLADIPNTDRSEMFRNLITHSNSPSMKAILIDCVREEIRTEANQRVKNGPFWTSALELVALILRPSDGRPPALPEEIDAVSSALNLYRYVLLAESGGSTNYSGVLSETNLRKAYTEWLLPLRTLLTGILSESRNDCDPHVGGDMTCSLNPVEMVLYRCIELVEEKLKDCR